MYQSSVHNFARIKSDCMLKAGFYMIATVTMIVEIGLKSISAIVVAMIAGEWFPYARKFSDRSNNMETSLK